MALTKQPVAINFASGLSQKVDPKGLSPGKFAALNNTVQSKLGLLEKRNGNKQLASLPYDDYTYLTTFNGNLTAISSNLAAYVAGQQQWVTKGSIQPVQLSTMPLIRSNTTQTFSDTAISASGLVCTSYIDAGALKVAVADSTTGQNVLAPYTLVADSGVTSDSPRVYLLGNYFIVIYTSATSHLVYVAIAIATLTVGTPQLISSTYGADANGSFDAVTAGSYLYIGFNSFTAGSEQYCYLTPQLILSAKTTVSQDTANLMSMSYDALTGQIWSVFANTSTSAVSAVLLDQALNVIPGFPVSIGTVSSVANVTAAVVGGVATVFIENNNNFAYTTSSPPTIASNYIEKASVTNAGAVTAPAVLLRSVGLASTAAVANDGNVYVQVAFQSPYQPSYYLINQSGNIVASLAYSNGGGYLVTGLPSLLVLANGNLSTSYLFKDLIEAVNKNTAVPAGSQIAGVYSQLGINMVTYTLTGSQLVSAEIGNNLNLNGGLLWGYDGYTPVENNFFVWPESVQAQWSSTGGAMAADPLSGSTIQPAYYYQVTYEWTDNQGNAFRSAPSVPVAVTTSGSGTTGSVLLNIPKLELTYKTANPVKIVIYRWSLGQQSYYQVTSILSPTLNNSGSDLDLIVYTDTLNDSSILGNNLIYTTGSVVENVSAPSFVATTLFDTRLWGIDAEDQNLLWFSKQVIEATPVEMSDLFTIYIPPSTGTGGSTGPLRCLAPMDDKLILFKDNAIYYINGTGPDNTGANSQYSAATFITSTVGCSNQRSIVLTPNGLMFQSNNGIWLLGRDLTTSFIGNPVTDYDGFTVLSAVNVPQTNQIRFNLDNATTLVYNYFFDQWSTFTGVAPISSIPYQGLIAFIDGLGRTFIENPGSYLDGSNPVLMSLTTSWFNLAGLQGFERFYYMQMLGTYYSPHKLQVAIGYDYQDSPSQIITITPDNYSAAWGGDTAWGTGSQWGGALPLEQWQVFPAAQKCQAFQISIEEQYDASLGQPNGAGLSLSGLNMIIGTKKGYAKLPSSRQAG